MLKLKVGDKVRITSGKDKGREGVIEQIIKGKMFVIPGVNVYKKHVKGAPGRKGGIYDIPRPLGASKISLICPNCQKTVRVGFKTIGGSKVRVCKNCGREVKSTKKG